MASVRPLIIHQYRRKGKKVIMGGVSYYVGVRDIRRMLGSGDHCERGQYLFVGEGIILV